MTNIVPALHAVDPVNAKINPLLCDIQAQIVHLFCREDYLQNIGQDWSETYNQRVALINQQFALQNNPSDALVDIIECWYRERYNG